MIELKKVYEHRQNLTYDSLFNRPKRLETLIELIKSKQSLVVRVKDKVNQVIFPVKKNIKIIKLLQNRDILTLKKMDYHFLSSTLCSSHPCLHLHLAFHSRYLNPFLLPSQYSPTSSGT